MRIVENFPPPPPKPLRTFDLIGVSEEELRFLFSAVSETIGEPGWTIFKAMKKALAE